MKKHKWLPVLLVVLVVCAIGAFWWLNNNDSVSLLESTTTLNAHKDGGTVASDLNLKKILYRSGSQYDLYSSNVDGSNPINLTKLLKLTPQYAGNVVSNSNVSKIAWVSSDGKKNSIWISDSDGTDSQKVYETNSTGCNVVVPYSVSLDGSALLISNLHYVEGEIGSCVPRGEAELSKDGQYYLRVGSPLKGPIGYYTADTNKNLTSINGFYFNDLLAYNYSNDKLISVSVVNSQNLQSTKLFDVPEKFASFGSQIVVSPYSSWVAYTKFDPGPTGDFINNEIGIFDYQTNTFEQIAKSDDHTVDYQAVNPSPNSENVLYVRELHERSGGLIKTDSYNYNVKTKQSTLLSLSTQGSVFSAIWKDNNSFLYLPSSYPVSDSYSITLFDLGNIKNKSLSIPATGLIHNLRI